MNPSRGWWQCVDCQWSSVDVPTDCQEAIPTCGQRETRYCTRCESMKCLEYTLSPMIPQNTVAHRSPCVPPPTAANPPSISESQHRHGPAEIAATAFLPDVSRLSSMTLEALKELQIRVVDFEKAIGKEISDRALCVICFAAKKEIVFYPCKHQSVCRGCGEKLEQCPICRTSIHDRILPFDA